MEAMPATFIAQVMLTTFIPADLVVYSTCSVGVEAFRSVMTRCITLNVGKVYAFSGGCIAQR